MENVDTKPLELCKILLADLLESADEWPVSFRLLFGLIRTHISNKYKLTDTLAVEEILRLFLLRVVVPPVRIPENFRLLQTTPGPVSEVLKECTALLMAVATNNSTGATVAQLAFVGYARPLLVNFMVSFSNHATATLLYKSFHGSLEPSLRKLWQWRAIRDVHNEPEDDIGPAQLSRAGSSKEDLTLHRLSEVDSYYSFDSAGDARSKLKAFTDPEIWTRLASPRKKFWVGFQSGPSIRKFSTALPQDITTVYEFFHNAGSKTFRAHFPHIDSSTGPGQLWKLRVKLPGGFHSRTLELHRYDHLGDDSAYCFGEALETGNKNPRELRVICFYMEIDGNGTRLTTFFEFLESTPEQLVRLWSETLFDDLIAFRKRFCSRKSSEGSELRSKPSPNNGINRVSRSNSSQLPSPPVPRQ